MSLRLEVIEFFDPTNRSLVQRIPASGSAEIKYGAQLIVQQNQEAVFFRDGQALDTFGPGRHMLETANLPLITRLLTIPWEKSPFRALVYFVGKQTFVDQKWGTRQPIVLRDADLGAVRLRAFGRYSFRVADTTVLINTLIGTQGKYTTDEISAYLRDVILTRLTDLLGSQNISLYELPGKFDELSSAVRAKVAEEFRKYGLELVDFFISSITPPPEVQEAIDSRSSMGAVGDLRNFTMYQAAQSMRKMAEKEQQGNIADAGLGMGMGMMLPMFVQQALRQSSGSDSSSPSSPSGTSPGSAAGAVPPGIPQDPRELVRRVAQSSDWTLETSPAEWTLTVPLGALRKQRVLVRFDQPDNNGNPLIRFLSFAGPATDEVAMKALRKNSQMAHGSLAIEPTSAGDLLVVQSSVLADTADVLEISRTISSIAWYADQLEQEIFTDDRL